MYYMIYNYIENKKVDVTMSIGLLAPDKVFKGHGTRKYYVILRAVVVDCCKKLQAWT